MLIVALPVGAGAWFCVLREPEYGYRGVHLGMSLAEAKKVLEAYDDFRVEVAGQVSASDDRYLFFLECRSEPWSGFVAWAYGDEVTAVMGTRRGPNAAAHRRAVSEFRNRFGAESGSLKSATNTEVLYWGDVEFSVSLRIERVDGRVVILKRSPDYMAFVIWSGEGPRPRL
ncbi:MAG: hypothetical protein ACYS99_06265 [Planctomycetota bacterium]